MSGASHKALRTRLLPLFTKKALSVYLEIQERTVRKFLNEWMTLGKEMEARWFVRDLNMTTSIDVFVGPYVDAKIRSEMAQNYFKMNEGFLTFPIYFPGTTLWKAVRAREKLVEQLTKFVTASKQAIAKGKAPECLLDVCIEALNKDIEEAKQNNLPDVEHSSDHEVACTVLDFLFASQDASTASLVWVLSLLDQHRDVLEKVRDEQFKFRPNDEPITQEMIAKMEYTNQVVKEVLRFRPPATMVPHVAIKDTQLDYNYTIKKGSIVLPSIWCSSFEKDGFIDAQKFDPDRFNPERQEHVKYAKFYLAFGIGPHACMGREYANNHLICFTAIAARTMDWKRRRTPHSDEIVFGPTIFPADHCIIQCHPYKRS